MVAAAARPFYFGMSDRGIPGPVECYIWELPLGNRKLVCPAFGRKRNMKARYWWKVGIVVNAVVAEMH